MQDNLLLPESGSVRSVELDVRFSPESYIRVRLEKTPGRGRVCYFVRNGDTAEQGEGACSIAAFDRVAGVLAEIRPGGCVPADGTVGSRLSVNDDIAISSLPAETLKLLTAAIAGEVGDLAFLEDLPL